MAAPEPPPRQPDPLITGPDRWSPGPRVMLMAGVAGACLLGAVAGAWVRPQAEDLKRHETRPAPRVRPAEPRLRIVVDDTLPPAAAPMDVLPALPSPRPKPAPVRMPPPDVRRIEVADKPAEPPQARPRPEKPKIAKADPPKKPEAKPVRLARAEPKPKPKAEKKPKPPTFLAKAEPKPRPKAVAKPVILAKAPARPPPAPVKIAAKPAPAPKVEAPVKLAQAAPPPKAKPPAKTTQPRLQQAKAPVSPWADEERRVARAYRQALEAGVPEWRLARQQARWVAARDQAMREAPWAVSEVYAARIAELDDLAGEASIEW